MARLDGKVAIVSAAHPIWAGDEVIGAVVAEETTNSILVARNAALERLLLITLVVFALVALALLGFASRLSWRIRQLRDEADSAIDAQGRITGSIPGSHSGDEVGDLTRSFSRVLARLSAHHGYLEGMASRLSHELRTPIAVVRSSLENLRLADLPEGIEAAIARDLAAAVARLAAEYLLGEGQRGLSTDRLPGGFDLQLEGDWSEDRAYLKVRLVAKANQKTLWSQRLIASRVLDGRRELPQLVFETTEAQLM